MPDIQVLDAPVATPDGVLRFQAQVHERFNVLAERVKAGRPVTEEEWNRLETAMQDFGRVQDTIQQSERTRRSAHGRNVG